MKQYSWSDDDAAEYDELVAQALREKKTGDRTDVFLKGLDRALALHPKAQQCTRATCWAVTVGLMIRNDGASRILKAEQERRIPRVPVAHNGSVLGAVPHEMGVTVRDQRGQASYQRSLFEFMTWEELRTKRKEAASMRDANDVIALACSKLLTLESRVAEAANPSQACQALGVTFEDFLASTG